MSDVLKRLEEWRIRDKARAVNISIGSGFGATCWEVTLYQSKKNIIVSSFWNEEGDSFSECAYGTLKYGEYKDDPSLEEVIEEALLRAEAMK